MLSRLRRLAPRSPDDGEEQSLVMPASKGGAYSKDPQKGEPGKESDDIALNTVYGTVHVDPPPVSTLKHDGGYINPEALQQLHEGLEPAPLPGTVPRTPKKPDPTPAVNGHTLPGSDPPQDRRPNTVKPWDRWISNLVDFWRDRTGFEQKLLVVSVAFAVVIIGCVIGVVVVNHHVFSVSLQESRLCLTRECIRAAGEFMANMDDSVDPCEDFYEFGCGGWEDEHPMPEGSSSWSTFQIVDEILSLKLHELLATSSDGNESKPVTSAKHLYRACMDSDSWKEQGLKPLLDLIKSYGGLPMITKNWTDDGFDWKKLSSALRNRQGFNILFSVEVETDWKNNSRNALYIDQPKLFVGRPYLLDNTSSEAVKLNVLNYFRSSARNLMTPEGLHLDADVDKQLKKDLLNLWDFMVKLASISKPSEERRDLWSMYNNMSLAELSNITKQKIDWLDHLQDVFKDSGVEINPSQTVVVQEIDYMKKLMDIIENTTSRDLANYLVFHLVTTFGEEATASLEVEAVDFRRKLDTQGIGRGSTRPWHDCTEKVNQLLGMALGSLYVKAHVSSSAVQGAKAMVEDLEVSFGEQLRAAAWMDEATYEQAKQKLDKIRTHVAYPAYLTDAKKLEEHYEGLPEMGDKTHFQNILKLNRYWTNKSLAELFISPSRSTWPSIPAMVNAFYSPTQNSITFPAGILQPPFYRDNTITSLNYGGIGSVIGHEITHGFDDTGRQSDGDGNLREWGTLETKERYLEKALCFVQQYTNYSVPELSTENVTVQLNGINTLGENIADNGGLRAAWLAYKRRTSLSQENLRLPGLEEYNQDQLFFLAFANIWCSTHSQRGIRSQVLTGAHAPGRYRVRGSLSNFPEFAQTFKCDVSSSMNPLKKCMLW